jgi:hypothetical protein
MNTKVWLLGLAALLFAGSLPAQEEKYFADWQSLARHREAPEWYRDAKFGIYFHWGVYSVPAYGNEWYPRWMHFEGYAHRGAHDYYAHHVKAYGPPSEFGYHDFVPLFKAEHYTRSKDDLILYVIVMGRPAAGEKIAATSVNARFFKIKNITMLGSDEVIRWELGRQGLELTMPAEAPSDMAVVFKVEKEF